MEYDEILKKEEKRANKINDKINELIMEKQQIIGRMTMLLELKSRENGKALQTEELSNKSEEDI